MAAYNKSVQMVTGRRKSERLQSEASSPEPSIEKEGIVDKLTQENLEKLPDTSHYLNIDMNAPMASIEAPDPPLSNGGTMQDMSGPDSHSPSLSTVSARSVSPESSYFMSMFPRHHPNFVQLHHGTYHHPLEYKTGGVVDLKNCHWCQFGVWESHKCHPTSILNQVEGEKHILLDVKQFTFIEENILSKGVEKAGEEFEAGCDCVQDDDCTTSGCACLQDIETDGEDPKHHISAYYSSGAAKGFLRKEMLDSRDPIYECNDKCNCSKDCPNRVVGNGRKTSLQIFRTDDGRGWGLRSTEDIQMGEYVGSYVGEIITHKEADRRRNKEEHAELKDVYLFGLDKFSDPASHDNRLAGDPYEIDGEFKSGPTRFINHSCDPNLRIFAVVRSHANKHLHDLCFFALSEIPRYTELTFDYTDGITGSDGKALEEEIKDAGKRKAMTECLCGAANCRGYLW